MGIEHASEPRLLRIRASKVAVEIVRDADSANTARANQRDQSSSGQNSSATTTRDRASRP